MGSPLKNIEYTVKLDLQYVMAEENLNSPDINIYGKNVCNVFV